MLLTSGLDGVLHILDVGVAETVDQVKRGAGIGEGRRLRGIEAGERVAVRDLIGAVVVAAVGVDPEVARSCVQLNDDRLARST